MKQQQLKSLLLTAVSVAIGLCHQAEAQSVAFRTFGSGSEYSPLSGEYWGTGHGTHLGKHSIFGEVVSDQTGPLTFEWETATPQETIAADGSTIFFTGGGEVELIPLDNLGNFIAIWQGTFEVAGGEGRFENVGPAEEPLTVTAINDPFNIFTDPIWTFSWELSGRIDLGKKSK